MLNTINICVDTLFIKVLTMFKTPLINLKRIYCAYFKFNTYQSMYGILIQPVDDTHLSF